MKKVGVLLSGCGVNDGAEIHESVITMLALDRADVEMILMAPNICLLYTSPSPRDKRQSRMPSSA